MAAFTTIDDPSAYFKIQLYTGNGSANHAITFDDTDTDMQPDLVWIKNRDATDQQMWFDSVRGATKVLHPNHSSAESTDTDTLDSFTSDGFQVDADVKVNTNTEDYVAWCWKESTTSGFDIDLFDGTGATRTEAHGLSAVPHYWVISRLDEADGSRWCVYHHKNTDAPETDNLQMSTDAATVDVTRWNDTAPTSSVFSLSGDTSINGDGGEFSAYLWTGKQGFSKFGTYEGTGNADGAFVYTGFRPAFVLMKCIDSAGTDWNIWDNRRPGYNPNYYLPPNKNLAEVTAHELDLLSNGFKARANNNDQNKAANTYIYAAFAEAPFVNSNGVPCNAR